MPCPGHRVETLLAICGQPPDLPAARFALHFGASQAGALAAYIYGALAEHFLAPRTRESDLLKRLSEVFGMKSYSKLSFVLVPVGHFSTVTCKCQANSGSYGRDDKGR
jgi:hypothetical protein